MKNSGKIVYYQDELNDEFSTVKIKPRIIDENYKYLHKSTLWNIASFIVQNIILVPIRIGYAKIKFKIKYIGKEKIKEYKNSGYFVYVNHTQPFGDTLIPTIPIYPKRNFFIVNPENVSMKILGNFVQMMGAIPIPSNLEAMKNFKKAIEEIVYKKHAITIYPEAHIWPYYTKIRPFKNTSFTYPIELEIPTFCITNTYQCCGKNGVKIVSYIDGPFFPNKDLSKALQKKDLRDKVYNQMVERSKNSNIEIVKYCKAEDATNQQS